jgi:parallel beta-helix repeat protein
MRIGTRRTALLLAISFSLLTLGNNGCENVIVVRDGESIQAAVDAANPGDTIVVANGFYTASGVDAVVEVLKDDITLIGNPNAVIDATGLRWGVKVGDDAGGTLCQTASVSNFKIEGFTIQNADRTGLYLTNVDGYSVTRGRYLDNDEYGPYPVCSTNGRIAYNFASGHNDAAIYVGQSDGAVIEFNSVIDSVIGIEIENTSNTVVRKNLTMANTAGIFVVVLPGLNIPFTENVLVEENNVRDNNRENTAGGGNLALLPEGTGILNIGGDNVVIRNNNVNRNDSVGIASIGNPFFLFDPRIDKFVDGLEVRDNVVQKNGRNPDPDRALTPGADIVFVPDVINPSAGGSLIEPDPDPFDNCFDRNVYKTEFVQATVVPGATLDDFPCP